MKKIMSISFMAASTLLFASTADDIAKLEKEIKKLKQKINKVNAHDANDNLKWGVDFRTAIDSIKYNMADGSEQKNSDLMSMRLWLNMAYAVDRHNIFKGQLSMNKAFGADFGMPPSLNAGRSGLDAMSMGGMFDWTSNEVLTDNDLKVKQAYWLYLGDNAFGSDIPWTLSVGRRPATNGFLISLREDDVAQSPLGHNINLEFDGLSSKLDLSNITGIPGLTFKLCMGQGSTNAKPMFETSTPYATGENYIAKNIEDIQLAGFIIEPYNDGQIKTKLNWFKAFDLPDLVDAMDSTKGMDQYGDLEGGAFSILIDGLTEDGYFSDVKAFASFAWSITRPYKGKAMLGSTEDETGTSWWIGTQLPVSDQGKFGIEYNHGSQYWRSFTYAEDTMIGSKVAARGDAFDIYFTYQLTDALSAQARYTRIEYDYTGSNGFFGNATGTPMKIEDIKMGAEAGDPMAQAMLPYIVESADDFRFYIRYRF